MYKINLIEKQPIFFNSIEEVMTKLIEDVSFADDIFQTFTDVYKILEKIDEPDTHYVFVCDSNSSFSESSGMIPSEFDTMSLEFAEEQFTIYWKQKKDPEDYCFLTLFKPTKQVN
jgi:hypothetical protein